MALGTGIGADNVLFGGHALYYLQTRQPRLRVALIVGAGSEAPVTQPREGAWGVRGGAFLAFGKRHRLVVGLNGGTMGMWSYSLHGTPVRSLPGYGMSLNLGWEWMTRGGFYARASIGPKFAVLPERALLTRDSMVGVEFTLLSVGYKLW